LAGSALLDAAVQEVRTAGALTPDRVRDLLNYMGHPPQRASDVERLRPVLEDALRAMQVIRDFEIPIDLEPAFVFQPH